MIAGVFLLIGPKNVSGFFLKESRMQATIITSIGKSLVCIVFATTISIATGVAIGIALDIAMGKSIYTTVGTAVGTAFPYCFSLLLFLLL